VIRSSSSGCGHHSWQPRHPKRRHLLILKAFSYSDVTSITFAFLWRFRELVWIGIGLLCLAMMDRGHRSLRDSDAQDRPY
jgi:hypothetical protein